MVSAAQPALILASQSPRRRELLQQLGLSFRVAVADIDESLKAGEQPSDYVTRMAIEKVSAIAAELGRPLPILGADTSVVVDEVVLGKPGDPQQAAAMLSRLSGRSHWVLSAVAVMPCSGETCCLLNITEVNFRELDRAEIDAYIDTGEPMDKAGAYGIQGLAASFISSIKGSYSGVMGLPLFETARLLKKVGIAVLKPASEAP